jgi:putative ABC transport system permease protein
VLLATLALSLSTGVGIGLIPAWRSIRDEPGAALKSGGRRVVAAGHRARSALMTAQIALTLALTMCAGLLTRSLLQVSSIDSGFRADRVLLAQVSLPASRYPADRWATFFDDALQGIRALPAVEAAGAGAPLPLSGQEGLLRFGVRIEGWSQPEGAYDRVYLRWATPDYFRAMGIRLIRGRSFSDADLPTSAPVAVVDESFVQRYLPGEDPIGRNVRSSNDRVWRRVIGIVGAVHQSTLEAGPEPHLYVASRQLPSPSMTFVVRTSGDPLSLAPAVREQIRRVDSAQPVYNIRPLEELIDDALVTRRFNTRLLTLFATLAGILTMVGVYGMMSFAVGESTGEIGVRLALGADRQRILTLLVTRLALPVSIGTACGIALGLAGGRAISALLFGVSEHDPLTMAGAIAAMIAAAATGVFLPARRALAIDPAESLRAE